MLQLAMRLMRLALTIRHVTGCSGIAARPSPFRICFANPPFKGGGFACGRKQEADNCPL